MELTDKQAAILRYIREVQQQSGTSPTLREIQKRFGFASSFAANRHVMALEKKGALKRSGGRARSMALPDRPPLGVRIPILGMIPAGFPELTESEPTAEFLDIAPGFLGISSKTAVFGLRVRGDSMIDAHIVDGDLALLEHKPARHRDIVAAVIDGEVTLKRFISDGGRQFLKAENPRYPDLIPMLELVIQGVLRSVIRTSPSNL
jgi:repressor LexA